MKDTDKNLKRFFSIDDLATIRAVSEPRLSPDGLSAVCVISAIDAKEDCSRSNIVLINCQSRQQQILAEGSSPIWSPDGARLAYLAENGEETGIWLYNLNNQTKEFLTSIPESGYFINHLANKNFAWSPDGKSIAYLGADGQTEAGTPDPAQRVINRLLYKTKGGRGRQVYTDDYLTHIYIISTEEKNARPRLVFSSGYNEHSISWSPDSRQLCFISNVSGDADNNQWSNLFTVDIASGKATALTDHKASAYQPAWSPDGKYIAYLLTQNSINTNDSPAEDTHLYLLEASGGVPVCLTKQLDRRIEQLSWHPSSLSVWFTAGDRGSTLLYKAFISTGVIEKAIDGETHVLEYHIGANGSDIAYTATEDVNLPDLFLYNVDEHRLSALTGLRNELAASFILQPAESFWFDSFDNTPVQGWIMKPVGFDANVKYPLILIIHGGPHNMFGYEFEDRRQLLAAQGFGVLFINPRGSSGYGQAFSNGNLMDWGGGDYQDLMAGVDYVINKYNWIDADRLGVTGQSYGGYMTNRIITKTNRFKAAVADGSICNLISFSGTSIYHSLMEAEYGLVPDHFEQLWQASPLKDVKQVVTPTLFLHGATDMEVPFYQAEEMYIALKKRGVETSLVLYVGEGHGWRPDLLPSNRYDLFSRMIGWFKKYI